MNEGEQYKWKGCAHPAVLSLLECKCEVASQCSDGASPCQREEASSLSATGTLACSVADMQLMCPEIRKLFYSLRLLL